MDWRVHEGTRIARLPRPLQLPAVLVRNAVERGPRWRYEADGLATMHACPFMEDRQWSRRYEEMAAEWYSGQPEVDVRWRMWVMTQAARSARPLGGSWAEFGVYRGGCSFMLLATAGLPNGGRHWLFDTFAGIPAADLSDAERAKGLAGVLADTSRSYVEERLAPWREQIELVEGDVFETLGRTETGALGFVHLDLNAAAPTGACLEYTWPRLLPGAIVVLDDYGWDRYAEQREVIDAFLARRQETVLALPTGQGLVVKRG